MAQINFYALQVRVEIIFPLRSKNFVLRAFIVLKFSFYFFSFYFKF